MTNLSIIIPAYNCESNISVLLKSLLIQIGEYDEIIIVDDGSTDDTYDSCQMFLSDKRVKVISQENGGPAKARNTGIINSKANNYLWFIDADDSIKFNAISNIHNAMRHNKDMICFGYTQDIYHGNGLFCSQEIVFENKSTDHKHIIQEMLNKQLYNIVWNKVIKKSFIEEYNIYFEKLPLIEDVDWINRLVLKKPEMITFKDTIYNYKTEVNRINSVSTKFYKCRLEMSIKLNESYKEVSEMFGISEELKERISTIFLLDIYSSLFQYYLNDRDDDEKLIRDINLIFTSDNVKWSLKNAQASSTGSKIFGMLIKLKCSTLMRFYLKKRAKYR